MTEICMRATGITEIWLTLVLNSFLPTEEDIQINYTCATGTREDHGFRNI